MYDQMQFSSGGAHHAPPIFEEVTERVPIYTQEFAQNPHAHYEWMRQKFGGIVPVWIEEDKRTGEQIPAWLVTKYATAVQILHDPGRFPADPRKWQANLGGRELNVLPMMEYRPNALRTTGTVHARFRAAANASFDGLDLNGLHPVLEQTAIALVADFPRLLEERRDAMLKLRLEERREPAIDLINDYFVPLVFRSVVSYILGCPDDIGQRIADASKALFDAQHSREEVNALMNNALLELCNLKKVRPGNDVTSALVRHSANLSDEELIHAQVTNCSAGIEITVNLAANALLLMMTDERFNHHATPGRTLDHRSAIDEILAVDPPLANYCITYPASPVHIDDTWLPANQPVIISMAACSSDPEYGAERATGNKASLAWGGPSEHSCPAKAQTASYMIAEDAIDQLWDLAPDLQLAVSPEDLVWRPGPFHHALAEFPVFDPNLM